MSNGADSHRSLAWRRSVPGVDDRRVGATDAMIIHHWTCTAWQNKRGRALWPKGPFQADDGGAVMDFSRSRVAKSRYTSNGKHDLL